MPARILGHSFPAGLEMPPTPTAIFPLTRCQVSVPTLVMHARDDARVPFEGRRLAAGIHGARFVSLASRNHLILEDEPAFPRFVEEITSFLAA